MEKLIKDFITAAGAEKDPTVHLAAAIGHAKEILARLADHATVAAANKAKPDPAADKK